MPLGMPLSMPLSMPLRTAPVAGLVSLAWASTGRRRPTPGLGSGLLESIPTKQTGWPMGPHGRSVPEGSVGCGLRSKSGVGLFHLQHLDNMCLPALLPNRPLKAPTLSEETHYAGTVVSCPCVRPHQRMRQNGGTILDNLFLCLVSQGHVSMKIWSP